jgi:hypothetical protein
LRKVSGKKAARDLVNGLNELDDFVGQVEGSALTDRAKTLAYEAALIKAYVQIERVILRCLVASINTDTTTISAKMNVGFPKHLSDEVCEYLIVGDGYFDFKGRDGLLKVLQKYLPRDHWLVTVTRKPEYRADFETLFALRNHAAHESLSSKKAVREAVGQERLGSAGAWAKCQGRFTALTATLKTFAADLEAAAPY